MPQIKTLDCFVPEALAMIWLDATLRSFTRIIAYTVLLQSLLFGGKGIAGDGAPEGHPLISRFF